MQSQAICSYPCTHWSMLQTLTLIDLTIAMLFRHRSTNATCMSSTKLQNHTTNKHWKTCRWLLFSHTHTQTCWCIMLTQSILDQLIAVVVSSLNYLANISIYTWSCMRTHCDWHAHHMHIHMRSIVVDMHNPPCNSYTLHVCPANFWVVACVSRRCNQFDHWACMLDVVIISYIIYVIFSVAFICRLHMLFILHVIHRNIKNTLDHNTRT